MRKLAYTALDNWPEMLPCKRMLNCVERAPLSAEQRGEIQHRAPKPISVILNHNLAQSV